MSMPCYLLVGGSNCVLKDGYGARLQQQLPGEWRNSALGASPSLRGVEYLLNDQASLGKIDHIFFEYTLNDLVFEGSNTLDPLVHLNWLKCMASVETIRKKLIFILLHGKSASARIASGHSFVVDNYRKIISQFGVQHIDLFPLIGESVNSKGQVEVFKNNDHFTPHMVQSLVSKTMAKLPKCSVERASQLEGSIPTNIKVVALDPLADAHIYNVPSHEFKTKLVEVKLARMTESSEIRFKSPGGALVGFYAVSDHDSGFVRITCQQREIVKAVQHKFGVGRKPYMALRHLTTPLYTRANEDIYIRYAHDIFSIPNASLDNTNGQIINGIKVGTQVDVGKFIFLV